MGSETIATPPPVTWAQLNSCVYLTFNVECEKPEVRIEKKIVSFKGIGAPEQKLYEVDIPLYAEIDPEKSTLVNKGRLIELVLVKKKVDGTFWPALTSDKIKHHWLRIDFNRWQDEEESDENNENNMDGMFSSQMADYEDDDTSSVEGEDLPDIE